jgi:hypothetical protein
MEGISSVDIKEVKRINHKVAFSVQASKGWWENQERIEIAVGVDL